MSKLTVFGICLALSFISAFADPIFLLSSHKIEHISDNVFLNQNSFTDLLNKKFLQTEELPNNIFVFNVKLNDKEYVQNPSLILKELSRYPSLQNRFGASSNVFSSAYVKDALSHEFYENILSALEKSNYHTFETPLNEFTFEAVRNVKRNANKNVATIVNVPTSELVQLDDLFHNLYSGFTQVSRNNHLIILKFTDNTPMLPTVLAGIKTTERMLQEGTAEEPAPTSDDAESAGTTTTSTGSATATATAIAISSAGFAGYVISIFGIIAIYLGFQIMMNIKAPSRFYKDQLQIGKEH